MTDRGNKCVGTAPLVLTPSLTNSTSNQVNYQLSNDSEFAFVLETRLSLASRGRGTTREILCAAPQIKGGDFESFNEEFKFLADQIYALGNNSEPKKFPSRSAKQCFELLRTTAQQTS